jgi:predicted branched-subunit amino acid permease
MTRTGHHTRPSGPEYAPYALVNSVVSLSFGVLAVKAGFSAIGAIAMSALVFAGSAQFAALAVIAQGGGLPAALSAATLVHSRYLPMGIGLAPSLPGGPLRRAVEGQAVVDASWAMANRGTGVSTGCSCSDRRHRSTSAG